jgi:hypothetical protein
MGDNQQADDQEKSEGNMLIDCVSDVNIKSNEIGQ